MSDPCPGLSVRIGERDREGPSVKTIHKKVDIGAKTADYSISVAPGAPFGIILKVKEDFDFKGSEGLRITITIHDGGFADDYPVVYTKSWYVDALSKWRGRQVFRRFNEAATPAGLIPHDEAFAMPHPKLDWSVDDLSGIIVVRVERGDLASGAIPSKTDISPEEFRRRSPRCKVRPSQFHISEGPEGSALAAQYEFRNWGIKDVMSTNGKVEKSLPEEFKADARMHDLPKVVPSEREPRITQKYLFRKYLDDATYAQQTEDNSDLNRSSTALLQAVEKLTVEPKAPAEDPLCKTDATVLQPKVHRYEWSSKTPKSQTPLSEAAHPKDRSVTTRRLVIDPVAILERDLDSFRLREMGLKNQKGAVSHYNDMASTSNIISCGLPAMEMPATYVQYGEVGKKDNALIVKGAEVPTSTEDSGTSGGKAKTVPIEKYTIPSLKKDMITSVKKRKTPSAKKDTTPSIKDDKLSSIKDKAKTFNDVMTTSDEQDEALSIIDAFDDDDDDDDDDSDYVMVDAPVAEEPVADEPQAGGCVCS